MMTNSNYENGLSQKNYRSNNRNDRNDSKGRFGSNRDIGGFRIRLSDNEMKSVKTIQEAFNLKSTVAVLGFSVRTLSEMINDDEFREAIKKYSLKNRNTSLKDNKNIANKNIKDSAPNPFARPSKVKKSEEDKPQDIGKDEK